MHGKNYTGGLGTRQKQPMNMERVSETCFRLLQHITNHIHL